MPLQQARMLRADLRSARAAWISEVVSVAEKSEREEGDFLAYQDLSGEIADFHALRHTFISNIVAGGVSAKTAQQLVTVHQD